MADLELEQQHWANGLKCVVGIDEAGRGPLAGPVAAAAVILPTDFFCDGLDDSKRLTGKRRDTIYESLVNDERICWSLSYAEVEEIDSVNILRATHAAMARAVEQLARKIDICLIDGLAVPNFPWAHEGVVKGDGKSLSIAAASIIAKVSRDRRMCEYAAEYPGYGFEKHKGYGTKAHLEALENHGPCRIHRRSFQPVAQRLLPLGDL